MNENNTVEKKKDGSILGTILGFIFIGMLVCGFLFMGDVVEFINEKLPDVGHATGIDRDDTNPYDSTKYFVIDGYYTKQGATGDTLSLILRSDNTFALDDSSDNCYNPLVGTYEKIDNNTVTLTGKTYYGCDSCYYKNGVNIRKLTIRVEEGKAILNGEYIKENTLEEQKNINRYIVEPENGTIPNGNNETWLYCEEE